MTRSDAEKEGLVYPDESAEYWKGMAMSYESTVRKLIEAINMPAHSKWTPATKHPNKRERVLVFCCDGCMTDGYYDDGWWWCALSERCYTDEEGMITAWMPMPEVPE